MSEVDGWLVRAEFIDGSSFTMVWESNAEAEEERVIGTVEFQFNFGNYSCDCNRSLQLGMDPPLPCGETLILKKLVLIRPVGTEIDLGMSEEHQ